MSKGYVIFTEAIHEPTGMDAYGQKAMPAVVQAGGKVIVAHDGPEVLEGGWHGTRTVIIEFESVDAARDWYRSADYQAAIPLRHAAADTNVVIVAGFEMQPS